MTKISIDLNPCEGKVITSAEFTAITNGCLETLLALGKLGEVIEMFRITWIDLGKGPGPKFTIYFCDPLGEKSYYNADYRFLGKGGTQPSANEIAEHFCSNDCLPSFISKHLESCKARLQKATELLSRVEYVSVFLPETPDCPLCNQPTVRNGNKYRCTNCDHVQEITQ